MLLVCSHVTEFILFQDMVHPYGKSGILLFSPGIHSLEVIFDFDEAAGKKLVLYKYSTKEYKACVVHRAQKTEVQVFVHE